jgi:dihydrofolate reductase
MRKIIASLAMSVDGFIEGPNGEMDWVMEEDEETWKYMFEMLSHVDTFILGRKMYPVYEQYWLAVLADPGAILPFSGRVATNNEITFARLADSTRHVVLSVYLTF